MSIILNFIFKFFTFLFFGNVLIAQPIHNIYVNCDENIPKPLVLGNYYNTSLRNAPPNEVLDRMEKEYGKAKIIRCWLFLDDMWDYRTEEYRFNFKIGKDYYVGDTIKFHGQSPNPSAVSYESEIFYEDYLSSVSQHCDEIMLNVMRYIKEIQQQTISIEEWKEVVKTGLMHYKIKFPKIRYIEVLNESKVPHFGGVPYDEYYTYYRVVNNAVNEINRELNPELPLLIGGNANHYPKGLTEFFDDFATDSSRSKRIDFISLHEYGAADIPMKFKGIEDEVKSMLDDFNIEKRIPIFVTELGFKGLPTTDIKDNLKQAAFITSAIFFNRHAKQMKLFPWVLYHTPMQLSHVQFDTKNRMTPFGASLKMLNYHKKREVKTFFGANSKDGKGLKILATKDQKSIAIQVWNYEGKEGSVRVNLKQLDQVINSTKVKIRKFLIDSDHSNVLTSATGIGELELVKEEIARRTKITQLKQTLESNALVMWVLDEL